MISLDDLIEANRTLGAAALGPVFARTYSAISYDSRTVRPGDLFVAVRTARADGHEFVRQACARGAAGVLLERPVDVAEFGATCALVPDTRAALVNWARLILERQAPEVIAVAGGVGKTSTEAAIVRALSAGEADDTIFQNGNLNDLFGLPIALGGLQPNHQLAVLELASDRPGEMAELVEIAHPRAAVITNVAPVHQDSLGGLDRVIDELRALVRALPADGCLILNGDDPHLQAFAREARCRVITYGFAPDLSVRAAEASAGPEGLSFTLASGDVEQEVTSPLLGFHNVYTLLAAAAVGISRRVPLTDLVARLAGIEPLPGRLRPLRGIEGTTILDDTQSASPRSLAAALEALHLFPPQRIVVLGDVSDLGAGHPVEDQALAAQLAASADIAVAIGPGADALVRDAGAWGLAEEAQIHVSAPADAITALRPRVRPGDTILVKGAEQARLERVVEVLLERTEEAQSLLVRQDPGWKQRVFLPHERPTWIELDLAALARNVELICEMAGPGVELMIVLKADAYGHGAVQAARTALLHGASMGGVACLSEAVTLREAGVRAPLLILGHVPAWQARDVVRHSLTATVYSLDLARHLSRAAEAAGARPVPVHVKVDTGMSRLGLFPDEVPSFIDEITSLPGIEVEGIFTHFATADAGPDDPFATLQLRRFRSLLDRLTGAGHRFRYIHAANSAGLLNGFNDGCNLVRCGILAYGLDPSETTRCPSEFRPVLSFRTRIAQVKWLPAGACVSYGCSFVTERRSLIAVIPVGYGDGFRRSPNGWGEVLVRGRRAPVVGNVCMDMAMLDVTDVPGVREGDEVVLIGTQGEERISAGEVARRLGTINYEVVTQILPRVPRMVP
jgi:alanine racemase